MYTVHFSVESSVMACLTTVGQRLSTILLHLALSAIGLHGYDRDNYTDDNSIEWRCSAICVDGFFCIRIILHDQQTWLTIVFTILPLCIRFTRVRVGMFLKITLPFY